VTGLRWLWYGAVVARLLLLVAFLAVAGCSGKSGSTTDGRPEDDAASPTDATTDAGSESDSGVDAGDQPVRRVYSGTLDSEGDATVAAPEIAIDAMPLVIGYVFSDAYAEPGYVPIGNIIPDDGMFRFAAGSSNAGAAYRLVVVDPERMETGVLDAEGNATLAVPEVSIAEMPLVMGYVYSTEYAEPGYLPLGNLIPGDGTFRFAAGAAHANAQYVPCHRLTCRH